MNNIENFVPLCYGKNASNTSQTLKKEKEENKVTLLTVLTFDINKKSFDVYCENLTLKLKLAKFSNH